ncbi:carotenoid ester lipase precursor [Trametes gibbosa]|nr:carotenoid ester lipase precursor [Trametes gibbosa]
MFSLAWVLAATAVVAHAAPAAVSTNPTVSIDDAQVVGVTNGSTTQYLGIPYAQPPVGDLRLRLPQPVPAYSGTIDATRTGNICVQQNLNLPPFPSVVPEPAQQYLRDFVAIPAGVTQSEDCLNLNVITPTGVTPTSKLPVVVYIYGGGYQDGSDIALPGQAIVGKSITMNQPVIYVAMNYRLSALGFLGGKEVKEAGVGNLGLQDQRVALRWIQKYISAFGGDPSKVMIWGQSAGSVSVALHMLTNDGNSEGLFRAGFLESGTPGPFGDILELQGVYDQIVSDAGCASSDDTLNCLRTVPIETLSAAMDKSPSFVDYGQVNTPWNAHADGVFVTQPPEHLALAGKIANVPIVIGNTLDEGSAFAFFSLNVTTDAQFFDYIHSNFYPNAQSDEVAPLLDLYPADPAAGSPYGTGDNFAYSPQYKRIASFQGDWIVHGPRRLFTSVVSELQPVYAFLSEGNQVFGLGAAHATDLQNVYGGGDMAEYLIRFATTLDPNGDGAFQWPQYSNANPQLLTFQDGAVPLSLTADTYRAAQLANLTALSLKYPA